MEKRFRWKGNKIEGVVVASITSRMRKFRRSLLTATATGVILMGTVSCDDKLSARMGILEKDAEKTLETVEKVNSEQDEVLKELSAVLNNQDEVLKELSAVLNNQNVELNALRESLGKEERKRTAMLHSVEAQERRIQLLAGVFSQIEKAIAERDKANQREMVARAQAQLKRLEENRRLAEPIKKRIAALEIQERQILEKLKRANITYEVPAGTSSVLAQALMRDDQEARRKLLEIIRQELELVRAPLEREYAKLEALHAR